MSEFDDLEKEIAELRGQLEAVSEEVARRLEIEAKQRMLIERYLEHLSSRRFWTNRQRRWADFLPFWSFFSPLKVFSEKPWSVWAEDNFEALEADIKTAESNANANLSEFRRNFSFTMDDGEGGRKEVHPFRED